MENKALGRLDVICGLVCALVFVDMVATNASVGPSVIGWWVVCGLLVMLPNGFITAELSAAYPDQGGIYSWIARAFGSKWAARTSFIYWVNNALWVPSALIWISGCLATVFFPNLSYWGQVALCVALLWIGIGICCRNISESKWSNIFSAVAKIVVALIMLAAAIVAIINGTSAANPLGFKDILPSFAGGKALIFLPSVVYLCFGAEMVSASAGDMKNPKKDVPRSMVGVSILTVLVSAGCVWAMLYVLPVDSINLVTAPMDMVRAAFGSNLLAGIVGLLLVFCVFTQVLLYALGACITSCEAGKSGEFPALFAKESEKTGAPVGSLIIVGILATVTVVAYGFMAGSLEDLFFTIFAFTSILFFIPYIIMHAAYRKLKKKDGNTERPFKAPAGVVFSYICQMFLVCSLLLFIAVPGEPVDWSYTGPVLVGSIGCIIAGEIIINYQSRKRSK